jgi:hypothetical protein
MARACVLMHVDGDNDGLPTVPKSKDSPSVDANHKADIAIAGILADSSVVADLRQQNKQLEIDKQKLQGKVKELQGEVKELQDDNKTLRKFRQTMFGM